VYHRNHGQHQHRVPTEAVDGIGKLRGEIGADDGRHNKQKQKKSGDNQSRQAEVVNQFPEFCLVSKGNGFVCSFAHVAFLLI